MSAAFYVEDASGDQHLFTIADADYEPRFRAHAREWARYIRRPSTVREYVAKGIAHKLPTAGPMRVVVEHHEDPPERKRRRA